MYEESFEVGRTLTGHIFFANTILNKSQTPVSLYLTVWNRQYGADYLEQSALSLCP